MGARFHHRAAAARRLGVAVVSAVLLWSMPASAHDLERTQVSIAFARDGAFTLDVSNDPAWLKLRLEPFERQPGANFSDRVVLFVDGHEIRPTSVEFIPGDAIATYRLRGRMPLDARTLRWYYGLVVDPYPLMVRRADGRVVVEEIAGDAWSREIDLRGQFQKPIVSERLVLILVIALLGAPLAGRFASSNRDRIRHENTKTRN